MRDRQLCGAGSFWPDVANGSRLCENASKTITRRHDGLPWLLIGRGDQQGVQ
jgi:hypothetical protein